MIQSFSRRRGKRPPSPFFVLSQKGIEILQLQPWSFEITTNVVQVIPKKILLLPITGAMDKCDSPRLSHIPKNNEVDDMLLHHNKIKIQASSPGKDHTPLRRSSEICKESGYPGRANIPEASEILVSAMHRQSGFDCLNIA